MARGSQDDTRIENKKIGNASRVILPREVLKRMRVKAGDHLFLAEAPGGTYRIIPHGPDFKKQMNLAQGIMSRYRNTLRELAE